ncbi:glycosyltransferase family protein [Haloarcula hispanica]|uniref:hypothetical protein n=1 Tax=Haloarcula hispanica TaxID=51589 RepID=UPI0011981E7D|nr:hypothetical protein [Haloarcula hispanica]
MDRGILYFAKGDEFVLEAEKSAKRTQELMDYPITLVTDIDISPNPFDNIIIDDTEFTRSDKPKSLLRSPYEKTIFLDSDIWLEDSISELFDILDRFEMALAKDPKEPHVHYMDKSHPIDGVPKAFPEYNTGVVAYNQTPGVTQLFEEWKERCKPEHDRDQLSFRSSLYRSDIRFTTLRPEYNCMYRSHNALNGDVKVFHGKLMEDPRYPSLDKALQKLNQHSGPRVSYGYDPYVETIPPRSVPIYLRSRLARLRSIIERRGIIAAVKQMGSFLWRRYNGSN